MRSGLFWKLFGLQVLAASAVLGCVLVMARTSSMHNFAEYLDERQREHVHELAAEIARAYEVDGDLLRASDDALAFPRHPRREEHEDHEGPRLPPLQLQDANGEVLRGDRREFRQPRLREPIVANGQTVGYLAWPKFPGHPDEAEFGRKQMKHLLIIAPLALIVSALCAAFITGLIVRPIREISAGAASLRRLDFGKRLPVTRHDELGQLAADFNRLAEALQGFDARQKQWLADIAHELRTPLSVLRGEVDALLEGVRTFGPNTVKSLSEEVRRLEVLIQDLHTVSLAESGGLRLHVADADLAEVVGEAAARFRQRLEEKGFVLKLELAQGLHAPLDTQRFGQVLGNLLNNALEYAAPPGPITLTTRAEGKQVVVSVADAGPGVPKDALPKLFDRLYRVDTARTRHVGGAGLGLSICRSIIEAHQGTIEARASASGGLDVLIRLPA